MRYTHQFFMRYLPFTKMHHADELTPGKDDFVYAKPGDIYAIYLKQGGSPKLDLIDAPGNFKVLWYDPRNGGELQEGDILKVAGAHAPGSLACCH